MAGLIDPRALARLREAQRVVALTGLGLAQESGVPSVRESLGGPWAGFDLSELATPQGFMRNPRLVWEWYAWRRQAVEACVPGPSHYALVDLEQYYTDFTVITQNVDGLHWRAGSRNLVEIHGNIMRTRCFECGAYELAWDEEGELPPTCLSCGGLLRPAVVWLGEGLPSDELRRAYRVAEQAEVFLSIGTSASVQPAAALPLIARRAGAFVIEINPAETALAVIADSWLQDQGGVVLPALVQELGIHRPDDWAF